MDILESLRQYANFAVIAHHIPGRIRIKLNADMADLREINASIDDAFSHRLAALPGIFSVQVNKFARSVTVGYDNQLIPDKAWPDFLAGRKSPEAVIFLNQLQNVCSQPLKT